MFDSAIRYLISLPLWLGAAAWPPQPAAAYVLPAEQAFRLSASAESNGEVVFTWGIAEGYYLYREKFQFTASTPGVEVGVPAYPEGEKHQDENLGETEVYRGRLDIRVPLLHTNGASRVDLSVTYQGCADQGICYPPQTQWMALTLPPPAKPNSANDLTRVFQGLVTRSPSDELLPPDQAFKFFAEVRDPQTLWVSWQIADGYYLYREKFQFALLDTAEARLGAYEIPHGEPKVDEEFGAVEVFHRDVGFALPILRHDQVPTALTLRAGFQGCAERGVCYPPMEKEVRLELPAVASLAAATLPSEPSALAAESEQDRIAQTLRSESLSLILPLFLGFGLLLAFTPCVFPMIPILSGLIVGQGRNLTTGRAFALSLSYVLAASATYTVFGVLAGLFGGNLQATFQEPWLIVAFSGVFVLLALSMFGFYTVQMPHSVQSRIAALSSRHSGGTLLGAAMMGSLSALIVGPCVAAPLAGALIYIGQTGDAWLGGLALFALGFGMGIPLLAIGVSAGKLLPKAGIWMNAVKSVFGVGLLAVAVWLLDRVLPTPVTMFLWALLLIIPAIYLGALDALPQPASGWRKLWKGLGIVLLSYGILLLAGVAVDSRDPLQPLRGLAGVVNARPGQAQNPAFEKVGSVAELERRLAAAQAEGRWVMLDYYADWCISCKEMEHDTFADPNVRLALDGVVLLQADVTANSPEDQALLKRFGLIGPPATLFFGPDAKERENTRIVGYMNAAQFLAHLRKVFGDAA